MAETRETQVIEDVINGDEISNPRTTEEAILAQVIAGEEVTINARTSLQKYLSQLTSGGSPITVEALSATENKTYTAPEGKAYSPVTVAVPSPNSVETFIGLTSNPWGNRFAELKSGVLNNNITVILENIALDMPFIMTVDNNGYFVGLGSYDSEDVDNGGIQAIVFNSQTGDFVIAWGISVGTMETDITVATNSTITVIHHPLPTGG